MPREKKRRSPRRGSLALTLLSALATGALRIGAATAASFHPATPTARGIRRWLYDIEEAAGDVRVDLAGTLERAAQRRKLARAIREIHRRRYVKIVKRHGRVCLEITERGRKALLPYTLHGLAIAPPEQWDGKWRVVLFDIPEKERSSRDVLRKHLRNTGFFQLQRSAFVLPYPCFHALDLIIQSVNAAPYVTFFETDSLGYHEASALAHFELSRSK